MSLLDCHVFNKGIFPHKIFWGPYFRRPGRGAAGDPRGRGYPHTAYRHPGTWSSPCLPPGVPLATGRRSFDPARRLGLFGLLPPYRTMAVSGGISCGTNVSDDPANVVYRICTTQSSVNRFRKPLLGPRSWPAAGHRTAGSDPCRTQVRWSGRHLLPVWGSRRWCHGPL